MLEHRRALVETRTLMLHFAADQISKLPAEIRHQLPTTGKIESRLRKLKTIDTSCVSTVAGEYPLSWLIPLIAQDRQARREIRQLERVIDELQDYHGTTLRDETGIGPIAAATVLAVVTPSGSPASISSLAGAASGPSLCLPEKETVNSSGIGSIPWPPAHQQRSLHRQRHPETRPRQRPELHRA